MTTVPLFCPPQTPPRASITMADLWVAVLRAAEDGLPLSALPAWLNAYETAQTPKFGDRPIDLLVLVMGTRRADLLAAVLDVPAFCPIETHRDRRVVSEVARRERWHGRDPFNGGLDAAAAMPGEPGMAWVEARVNAARQADASDLALQAGMGRSPGDGQPRLDAHDPLLQVPTAVRRTFDVQQQRQAQALGGRGFPEGYRYAGGTNLLGLAVMMGWDEGLQVLLDHGVDPYAHVGRRQAQASPLLLAGVYGEAVCATRLIQHPSFKPLARYGYTAAETQRRVSMPDVRGLPWSDRPERGGFDLTFVLENPMLIQNTAVRAALAPRLTKGVIKRLTAESNGLSDVAHRALERLVLEQALLEVSGGPAPTVERARSRL